MRVLLLSAHPDPESYGAALRGTIRDSLARAGHAVDDCDLYGEGFQPVLTREERVAYHDPQANRLPVAEHVARLQQAEALVLSFPVWNYGFPAIMKGYFDRVFLPGVSFTMDEGGVRPNLWHVRRLIAVTSYGGSRLRTMLMGDPPRKLVTRGLRVLCHPTARMSYLAHYDMNRATPESRAAFLARVEAKMARV